MKVSLKVFEFWDTKVSIYEKPFGFGVFSTHRYPEKNSDIQPSANKTAYQYESENCKVGKKALKK